MSQPASGAIAPPPFGSAFASALRARPPDDEGRSASRVAASTAPPRGKRPHRRYLRTVLRQKRIQETLSGALDPVVLDVVNESHMHSVAPGSETHFKVLVVSAAFEGKGLIERHRTVNGLLAGELQNGLHALTIRALTPAQWEADGAANFKSPPCLGGSKSSA